MANVDAVFADDVDQVRALATAPTIVTCGHSYGGSVITAAGTGVNGLAHLVYLAAFALDDGESSSDWYAKRPPAADLTLRRFTLRPQALIPSPVMSEPAWRRVPTTYVVAARHSVIRPDSQRRWPPV